MIRNEDELKKLREKIIAENSKYKKFICICNSTSCKARGGNKLVEVFREELKNNNLNVKILSNGCHGFCEQGPIVVILPENIFYCKVKVEDVKKIINDTIINNKIIEELLYFDEKTKQKIIYEDDIPFYKLQTRILFGNNKFIEPNKIEDYIGINGYTALPKALKMKPEEIINEVKKSGLRGRGGAGFPVGIKWETTRNAHEFPKYILCNADEGDPGAYANRSLLEANPHSVIEGMIIGSFAIGCNEGYIFIKYDFPLAIKMVEDAIEDCRRYGILGKNILNSKHDFDIFISKGGGAYVCGESTALMASVEGRTGEPRPKYVHTSERGLWDKPSCLNNVESFANIPLIINNGSGWFASIGTGDVSKSPWGGNKGTKIFSLVGKINNTGLVEVPLGTKLREIIYDIGGGIKNNKKFKAVQTGGPSGGLLPESLLDIEVEYDKMNETGSIMGSGGMIVMDEDNCMVDIAKYFLDFLLEESCGKCVPCREGLKQLNKVLIEITEGRGTEEKLQLIEDLTFVLKEASLCQLGGAASNPVLTTLKYFKEEYEEHIKKKKCSANICKMEGNNGKGN